MRPRLIIADEPVSMVDASLRATILESLRQLNREYGMSIVYITHDLTTAFQISDSIVVLYRGSVVEAGDVDLVVQQPRHPYTQLLIKSVPRPDPRRSWGEVEARGDAAERANGHGCSFAARCPYVMPDCRVDTPPLIKMDGARVAACLLYRDNGAALESRQLHEVMTA
jgi:peptide/nickel transport system ATP-binding protein